MLVLVSPVRKALCAHACEGYPDEVCGLLLGKTNGNDWASRREALFAIRAGNIETIRKRDRYQIDPADMAHAHAKARSLKLDVVGFYHSHPDHPAIASPTDLENSSPWGGYSYPIVSVVKGDAVDLRCWYRTEEAWVEEPIVESVE